MPWSVVAAVGSAYISSEASKDSSDAQTDAANQSNALSQSQYETTQSNLQPYMDAGTTALSDYQTAMSGDYSAFEESPDYQYALESGTKQLDRGATASGNLWGGGADADRIALGQGLATQNYDSYMDRLMNLAGLGQSSATSLASSGEANVDNQTSNNQSAANAQSTSSTDTANSYNSAINSIVGTVGRQSQYGTSSSNNSNSNSNWGKTTNNGNLGPSNGTNWNFG